MRIKVGVAAVALLLAGCTGTSSTEDAAPVIVPGAPGETAKTISPDDLGTDRYIAPNDRDLAYVAGMVVHHRQAVEMTELAPERASNEVVRGLAARIHDTQGPEIGAMEQWQRQYAATAGEHGHSGKMPDVDHAAMPGMATAEQMGELKAARGEEFDRVFVRLMVAHHKGALAMAEEVLSSGVDVKVEEMAADVIATQTDEINRMQGLGLG
ncbi:DUF305 domain-containing protein [Umezawaea tangerina]|uniref:Uncharacterized protein (DUF305 family) n=1 Tax=Umezawaea tangerina TaxID=84725 RepID=A0A2T0T3T8_9PSEU|nr:DUF305 domain-containing protein [Umezawaea tangerina]PRY40348.1 uncharacterized protein (DUF305 family) [Umezawaea tangerina]